MPNSTEIINEILEGAIPTPPSSFHEFLATRNLSVSRSSEEVFEDECDEDDCEEDYYCTCGCMEDDDERFQLSLNPFDTLNDYTEEDDYMTNTVSQAFRMPVDHSTIMPHPFVIGTHRVGVEIEIENIHCDMPRSVYWKDKEDGSLRNNGHEYVFRQPLGGHDLLVALQEIDSYLHDKNADTSWRCSTHVHLDVRDMTDKELKLLLLAYTVYERLIFRCSGWHRFKNNFCPAYSFAQGQIMTLSNNWHLSGTDFIRSVASSWAKYSSLNLLPMRSQGSVEFRMSEAKRHKGQLLRLCNRLLMLKHIAKTWEGSEKELVVYLMETPPMNVFGRKCLPKEFHSEPEDQVLGARLAVDIMHHRAVREKRLLPLGNTQFLVPDLGTRWEYITSAVLRANHQDKFPNIDFESNSQPSTMTFRDLRKLLKIVSLRTTLFLQDVSTYELYYTYDLACDAARADVS